MRLITTNVFTKAMGCSRQFLNQLAKAGKIAPIQPAAANGHPALWSPVDLTALLLCRHLGERGASKDLAGAVSGWLIGRSQADLEAAWADGRRFLFACGNRLVVPVLLSREQLHENPSIDLAAAQNLGVPMLIVDVQEVWGRVIEAVDALERMDAPASQPAADLCAN